MLCLCLRGVGVGVGVSGGGEALYLLLVQLEGGLDQVPQGCELLLLLILSLFDLQMENAMMGEKSPVIQSEELVLGCSTLTPTEAGF